jgi:hypothetical protein
MSNRDDSAVPKPQGRFLRLPFDFRRPTLARVKARAWNADDPRIFTPKTYGWGLGVNLYWLIHPIRFAQVRRSR